MRFAVTQPLLHWREAVAVRKVTTEADRKSRDHAAFGNAVEHRIFLGHPDRWIEEHRGFAHLHDGHIAAAGRARQD